MNLPFPKEELDALFHEICNRLTSQGNALPEEKLLVIFHRVMEGIEYLSRRYTEWWATLLEDDTIDVGNPARMPYYLVLVRFDLKVMESMRLSQDDMQKHGFAPFDFNDQDETAALNAFWQEPVLALKGESAVRRP